MSWGLGRDNWPLLYKTMEHKNFIANALEEPYSNA